MGRRVSIAEAAQLLRSHDKILILCHRSPDGDTLGSGYGLLHTLQALGKTARVDCADVIAERYSYMFPQEVSDFEPEYVVAVDVADPKLLGANEELWGDKVDLCIDHHGSNRDYAEHLLLEADSAAACEVLYLVAKELGVEITPLIADCFYTGIATDTGCFRYSNTSVRTHRIAAELMELGCHFQKINQLMFETKSRSQLAVEAEAMAPLEYHYSDRCAMITLTRDMVENNGASDDETEGLAALPRQIEDVWIGVTIKQMKDRTGYKFSLRSTEEADASAIAAKLGGGGHARAAGCSVKGDLLFARQAVLTAIAEHMGWEEEKVD